MVLNQFEISEDCFALDSERDEFIPRKLVLFLYPPVKDIVIQTGTRFRPVSLLSAEANPQNEFDEIPTAITWTTKVEAADFLVYPHYLDPLFGSVYYAHLLDFIHRLSCFGRFAHKHVFFLNDDLAIPLFVPAVTFRASVFKNHCDPRAEALAFETEDFSQHLDFNPSAFKHDVSFCGYVGSSVIRHRLLRAMLAFSGKLIRDINVINKFHGHLTDQSSEFITKRRQEYLRSIRESMLVLCPRGTGANSIRFFETLSMGRIPVLISDDVMLPFERDVNYDEFILRIPESDVEEAPQIILKWLEEHSMEALIKKCVLSRMTWQLFFSKRMHPHRIVECLQKYHIPSAEQALALKSQRLSPAEIRRTLQTWVANCIAQKDLLSAALYHDNYINTWPRRLISSEMTAQNRKLWNMVRQEIRDWMDQTTRRQTGRL